MRVHVWVDVIAYSPCVKNIACVCKGELFDQERRTFNEEEYYGDFKAKFTD